jgi:hypothetical protein
MSLLRLLPLLFVGLISPLLHAAEKPVISSTQWANLERGHPVIIDNNPKLTATKGKTYVTGVVLVNERTDNVWAVLNDYESGPSYIEDLVRVRVVASGDHSVLVEQGMKVNRRDYRYLVRLFPSEQREKLTFRLEKGCLRSMDGGWWLYQVEGGKTLLVHSLHLNPGVLCPKAVVRNSLEKKIPETLTAIKGEIQRRSGFASVR